jgi:SAM-dependent methyltransferase
VSESRTGDAPAADYSERMVPESAHARTFWEHVARYRFARRFVAGRSVLDVACGEGYGAAGLRKAGAASVVGVDASSGACEHASRKYGLDARVGDAAALPLPDGSVDVVVSFETIEHVADPAAFVRECARVLVPEGQLIVSTPNRPVYTGEAEGNPFHRVEFDEREFVELIGSQFRSVRLFTQFPESAAWWSPRSLAAERSPWLRVRGFWRLASRICPALRSEVPAEVRDSADAAIVGDDRWPSTLFNPYLVRPRSAWGRERPYYFIAVAEGVEGKSS